MTKRNTIQKEFVRAYMIQSHAHPTAFDILNDAVSKNMKIGLTSIYRILNDMVEKKELIGLTTSDGLVHFDWFAHVHAHFICEKCHKIIDLPANQNQLLENIVGTGNDIATLHNITIFGTCQECLKRKLDIS